MPPEVTRVDLVQGDAVRLRFQLLQVSATARATALASLAGATGTWRMRHNDGSLMATALATVYSATLALVDVMLATGHTATPGNYRGQLTLDFGSTIGVETVPKDEPYQVVIRARV